MAAAKALSANTAPLAHAARDGATDAELVAIFGVPASELEKYRALITKSRAELNARIRKAMLAAADKGGPEALAYLAKTYLEFKPTGEPTDAGR